MLVQRRATGKRMYPNCLDVSCAEHLQRGEKYHDGAVRGMIEELGFDVSPSPNIGTCVKSMVPLESEPRLQSFHFPDIGFIDNEMVLTYLVTLDDDRSDPSFVIQEIEVSEIKWMTVIDVLTLMELKPTSCTPWFLYYRHMLKTMVQ